MSLHPCGLFARYEFLFEHKSVPENQEMCEGPDLNRGTPARTDLESVAFDRAWLPSLEPLLSPYGYKDSQAQRRCPPADSSAGRCGASRGLGRSAGWQHINGRPEQEGIVLMSYRKRLKHSRDYTVKQAWRGLLVTTMEGHHQHTSPFPPEFRTTHNFFTKRGVRYASPPYIFHDAAGAPSLSEVKMRCTT